MCHLKIGDFELVLYICLSRILIQIKTEIAKNIEIARKIEIARSIQT